MLASDDLNPEGKTLSVRETTSKQLQSLLKADTYLFVYSGSCRKEFKILDEKCVLIVEDKHA